MGSKLQTGKGLGGGGRAPGLSLRKLADPLAPYDFGAESVL